MSITKVAILGNGDVETAVFDYYEKEDVAMCSIHPKKSNHNWENLFSTHDRVIPDYRNEPDEDRRDDTSILTATRKWQDQVIVLAKNYQECWSELKAINVKPRMVIARPPDGSTKFYGYRVDLHKAAISKQQQTSGEKGNGEEKRGERSVKPLLLSVGALLVVGGLWGLYFLPDGNDELDPLFRLLVTTGVGMLGIPQLHALAAAKAKP